MNKPSLSLLQRRWWWHVGNPSAERSENPIDPVACLNLVDPCGVPVLQQWRKDGWAKAGFPIPGSDFLEAAFRYEAQARFMQKCQAAPRPVYSLGKAFPLLSQTEKERLKILYPSRFKTSLPRIRDLRRCLNDPRYRNFIEGLSKGRDDAEVEIWLSMNLKTMRDTDLIGSFKKHLRRLREQTGFEEPVRRQKDHPWFTLELIDKWLSGWELKSYDIERARQVLNRYGKQSFQKDC